MSVLSFRAECRVDVDRLRAVLPQGCDLNVVPFDGEPDVMVEMQTDLSLDDARVLMARVPDGHVMVETLREAPMQMNSFKRQRMGA